MKQTLEQEEIAQILRDAGCSEDEVCRMLCHADDTACLLTHLSRRRAMLLDEVHRSEKKIDCLDYLIYRIQNIRRE